MSVTTEHYLTDPVITLVGGADFDYRLKLERVRATTVDGRTTEIIRLGTYDLTGWTSFAAAIASRDGAYTRTVSVVLDGPPADGTLRLRGVRSQTQYFQDLSVHGGYITILATNAAGQRLPLRRIQWVLEVGSTPPTTPTVSDWTTLS